MKFLFVSRLSIKAKISLLIFLIDSLLSLNVSLSFSPGKDLSLHIQTYNLDLVSF